MYSLWASLLSSQIPAAAEYIVRLENHSAQAEEDDSRIGKFFFLSTVISYAGLFYYQYVEQSYGYLCLLMICLQVFNQIIVNSLKAAEPYKEYPLKFAAHKKNFKPHCRRYPEDYEKFSRRATHEEAERQVLMGNMPANRIEDYSKIVVEFGWITFFGPCFPAAPLLGIISNLVMIRTEIDNIKSFQKRGEPRGVLDVGRWIELIEYIAVFSIVNSLGLVIFTSQKLDSLAPSEDTPWEKMIIGVFMVENMLLVFRYVLALLIPDEPGDIVEERRAMENRVRQIQGEIADKVLMTRLQESCSPLDLVEDVIGDLHNDRDLASLLVPKILKGCYAFEREMREAEEEMREAENQSAGGSGNGSARESSQAPVQGSKMNKARLKLD